MESNKPKVCIIGAGPTGLVALRHLQNIAECVCYEMKDQIGGLWVYKDTTDATADPDDPFKKLYGHTHESIYHDLTIIVPKHFFAYKDYPPMISDSHYTHQQVLEYLQGYSAHFDLEKHIKFNTAVVEVSLNKNRDVTKKWKVVTSTPEDEKDFTDYFDYVLVCNGHNSVPYFPYDNLTDFEKFKGNVLHSHNFRKPDTEEFLNKNILIVGARWSGLDLIYQFVDNKRLGGEVDFNKIVVNVTDPDYLSESENFKPYFENSKILVKKGKQLEFTKTL